MDTGLLATHLRQQGGGPVVDVDAIRQLQRKTEYKPVDVTSIGKGLLLSKGVIEQAQQAVKNDPPVVYQPHAFSETETVHKQTFTDAMPARTGDLVDPLPAVQSLISNEPGWTSTAKTGSVLAPKAKEQESAPQTVLNLSFTSGSGWSGSSAPDIEPVAAAAVTQEDESGASESVNDDAPDEESSSAASGNLYSQIMGRRSEVIQANGGKEYWAGEGFGSVEKNAQAMAKSLEEKGVTDLSQLSVREEPVMEDGQFEKMDNGTWIRVWQEEFGDGFRTERERVTDPALVEQLEAKAPPAKDVPAWVRRGNDPGPVRVNMTYDTGEKQQVLINQETGEAVEGVENFQGRDGLFRVGYTTAGKDMVHWVIAMQPIQSEDGSTSYAPVPLQIPQSTSDLGKIGMALNFASLIPGVAPFALGATAAIQASQGNWLMAALAGAGAYGSYLAGSANAAANSVVDSLASGNLDAARAAAAGRSSSLATASNIKTGVGAFNAARAASKGDALGAVEAGAGTYAGWSGAEPGWTSAASATSNAANLIKKLR